MTFKQIKSYIKKRKYSVDSHSYSFRRALLENGVCTKREWTGTNEWKNNPQYKIAVKDDDTITFDNCLYTEFKMKDNVLYATMHVYTSGFDGMYKEERCCLTFKITKSFKELVQLINEYIDKDAEEIIRKEDEEILRQRLYNARNGILQKL